MKQIPGSKNCVAVVAAMATNTTVEEVEEFMKDSECLKRTGGYCDSDIFKYLMSKGFCPGTNYWNNEGDKVITEDTQIQVQIRIKDVPAYIVVQSETREDWTHAIFWDGKQVWDPKSDAQDGRPLSDYKIYAWIPIFRFGKEW